MNTEHDIFLDAIYASASVPEVITKYASALRESSDPLDISHAFKLIEYKDLLSNRKFLNLCRRYLNSTYELVNQKFPSIPFNIKGRRKSLISFERKLRELKSSQDSLDLIRDLFAFRILVIEDNPQKAVESCYNIGLEVISLFVKNGFILCEANPLKNVSDTNHSGIYIPEESLIPKSLAYGVKDYIKYPKKNGYQSLHFCLRYKTGECIEIQIRSFTMHLHAENGEASHTNYKQRLYSAIPLDTEKVNMSGFGVSGDEEIDMIGLNQPLDLFVRAKSFVL